MTVSIHPIQVGLNNAEIKIIGGTGYDPRQPLPITYPSVRDNFLKSRDNFWSPKEIPMGTDKTQWNTGVLTPAEEWMFKCNISYLTASDNLVPDNLITAIFNQITASEVRQFLRHQIFEESNHIESYLFILESFGLDVKGQGKIFQLYQDVPELVNKLNWNINFTSNVVKGNFPEGSIESGRALLEDLISYYAFEFVFFPVNFTQIFALARQNKLKNTAQQYQFILRDENNHSENTLFMIRQIIKENPYLWDHRMINRAREIVAEAIDLEVAYGKVTLPDGGIEGMTLKSYNDYAMFMGNQMLINLGLPPTYNIKEHPMPWLSMYELKQEVNFFEGRPREYRVGAALSWD